MGIKNRLSVLDDYHQSTTYHNKSKRKKQIIKSKQDTGRVIQTPPINSTLDDPCTCGLYPNKSCSGKKPCPHE